MLLSDEKFFTETLDDTVPACHEAKMRFLAGDLAGAKETIVAHFGASLKKKAYFDIAYNRRFMEENADEEKVCRAADVILGGTLSSVGIPYTFPDGKVDWEFNPTYNNYSEWTWQLSRHPCFLTLARAYQLSGKEVYAQGFSRLMNSWLDQAVCPESASGYATKTWRSLEAGLRMEQPWNYAIHVFMGSPSLDTETWFRVLKSLWEHAYRIRGFCTSHNWLITEMSGLANLGLFYPFFRDADEWRTFAMKMLEDELDVQLYPDGFQYELTTGYHWVNVQTYRNFIQVFRAYGVEPSRHLLDCVHKMILFYAKIRMPDGTVPDLNDGMRGNTASLFRTGLTDFPDDPVMRYFTTEGKEGHLPDYVSVALPYSGLAVMRSGWERDAIWGMLESAPFGFAHQHEDKLTFHLHAYGKCLLSDTGSYDYDTSEMRKMALSTRGHNTALVDYEGQNRRENYHWEPEDIRKPADLTWSFGETYDIAEGFYADGYGPDFIPVTHRRKVIFFKKGLPGTAPFFLLLDDFLPEDGSEHTYEVLFQLGTEPIRAQARTVTAEHADGVTLSLIGSAYPKILIGQKTPRFMGWRSDRVTKGEHEHFPAPAVLFTDSVAGAHRMATVAYPARDGNMPIASVHVAPTSGEFTITLTDGTSYTMNADSKEFATSWQDCKE